MWWEARKCVYAGGTRAGRSATLLKSKWKKFRNHVVLLSKAAHGKWGNAKPVIIRERKANNSIERRLLRRCARLPVRRCSAVTSVERNGAKRGRWGLDKSACVPNGSTVQAAPSVVQNFHHPKAKIASREKERAAAIFYWSSIDDFAINANVIYEKKSIIEIALSKSCTENNKYNVINQHINLWSYPRNRMRERASLSGVRRAEAARLRQMKIWKLSMSHMRRA